jgi:hypothetical protein
MAALDVPVAQVEALWSLAFAAPYPAALDHASALRAAQLRLGTPVCLDYLQAGNALLPV